MLKQFSPDGEFLGYADSERENEDIMQILVHRWQPDPLDKLDFKPYELPQGAIGIYGDVIKAINNDETLSDTDIVLNADGLEDSIVNYGFTIYSTSRDEFVQKGEVKRITAFENVYVEGYIRAVQKRKEF